MSRQAAEEYEAERNRQLTVNEARHIHDLVEQARQSWERSAARWPFELLQNAHDAGPREELSSVAVKVVAGPSELVVEHDGAAFTTKDLASLFSGGSNKKREDIATTGRFGQDFRFAPKEWAT